MNRSDVEKLRNAFYNAQFSKTCHKKYQSVLTELYNKYSLNEFFNEFISCLTIPLSYNGKESHVQNVLEMAANFTVNQQPLQETDIDEEQMCPFTNKLFNWLLYHHNVKDIAMRHGICSFINTLLSAMGMNAYIDDELSEKIINNMMERLQDKSPKVRVQAILALARLQEPTDPECPVIKLFINHLLKDPHADVRKAVLNCMAKTQFTLMNVLKKITDVNEDVRKMAYVFISKITVKSLSIRQREFILNHGLKDPSEKVRQCVKMTLLPNWLMYYKNDYINLLKGLDAENCSEMVSTCLDVLLRNADINSIMEQLPVDKTTRVIPINELKSENILLWRHFIMYLKEANLMEYADELLPELSDFCTYIRLFITEISKTNSETWEVISRQFVLLQLFEISKLYDLSDEAGRNQLKHLMMDALLLKDIYVSDISEDVIKCIVKYMEIVIPNVDERLNAAMHVISELRMPSEQQSQPEQLTENESDEIRIKKSKLKIKLNELTENQYQAVKNQNYLKAEELKNEIEIVKKELKEIEKIKNELIVEMESPQENYQEEKNDIETLWKCLTILTSVMQSASIKSLTPTLRTVAENLAFINIVHENYNICSLALTVVGICCLLDSELAKKYFISFVLYMSVDKQNDEIFKTSLMTIIDMLLCYGLQHFDLENCIENLSKQKKNRTLKTYDSTFIGEVEDINTEAINESENIITNIIKLLDHQNEEFQYMATEGLCKLLLSGRISSSNLLSHLIIMLFNPINERNVSLRRTLINFFNCYVNIVVESQSMLEEAFLPTLRFLENAPSSSPLKLIDSLKVAEMFLGFTTCNATKTNVEDYTVHNNLTFKILNEIIEFQYKINLDVLVKSLKFMIVKFDDAQKELVIKELENAENIVQQEDKYLVKYIQQFRIKVEDVEDRKESVTENDEEKND